MPVLLLEVPVSHVLSQKSYIRPGTMKRFSVVCFLASVQKESAVSEVSPHNINNCSPLPLNTCDVGLPSVADGLHYSSASDKFAVL
jgi:hypothetical protein